MSRWRWSSGPAGCPPSAAAPAPSSPRHSPSPPTSSTRDAPVLVMVFVLFFSGLPLVSWPPRPSRHWEGRKCQCGRCVFVCIVAARAVKWHRRCEGRTSTGTPGPLCVAPRRDQPLFLLSFFKKGPFWRTIIFSTLDSPPLHANDSVRHSTRSSGFAVGPRVGSPVEEPLSVLGCFHSACRPQIFKQLRGSMGKKENRNAIEYGIGRESIFIFVESTNASGRETLSSRNRQNGLSLPIIQLLCFVVFFHSFLAFHFFQYNKTFSVASSLHLVMAALPRSVMIQSVVSAVASIMNGCGGDTGRATKDITDMCAAYPSLFPEVDTHGAPHGRVTNAAQDSRNGAHRVPREAVQHTHHYVDTCALPA